ncbi:hypothetical protein ACSSV1_001703 [Labrenzia sp. MBR-25]
MEPAIGFSSRLARLNGRPLRPFLFDMGLPTRSIEQDNVASIKRVAVLGGADAEKLLQYTPFRLPDGKRFILSNEVFDKESVHRTFFRFCPHCVREDHETYDGPAIARPWLRLGWILAPIRSCPKHNVLLIKTDPKGQQYQYFDFSRTLDAYRTELEHLARDARPMPPSSFQKWLLARIRGDANESTWLDDVPAYAAIAFCEGLGVSTLHPPKVKTSQLTEVDWAAAAETGFLIARDGETSIRLQLKKLNEAQVSTKGVLGLRDTYGHVYDVLRKTTDDPGYEKLRNTVRQFAMETLPLATGTVVLGDVVGKQTVHSIRSAAMAANVHANTMRKIFEREGFHGDTDIYSLSDHRVIASNEKLLTIIAELREAISTPVVMDRMQIPKHYLNSVIEQGYLRTVTGSDQRSNAKHQFLPQDVTSALTAMFDGAEIISEPSDRQMTVPEARAASVTSIDFIMSLVFEGNLKWKGRLPGPEIFPNLLVDVDEVIEQVRREAKGSGIPKHQIDEHVPGIGKHVLKFIEAGELELVEEYSPDARRMVPVVSRESADAFVARYVSLGELSRNRGLHHKQVRKILNSVDVQTAFDTARFGVFVYDRSQILTAERTRPQMWDQ